MRSQPDLHVQSPQHVLNIHDPCFHLDHEQDPARLMETKQVDPSAVPVVVEAHFHVRPPAFGPEPMHASLLKRRVAGIHQAVEVFPTQPNVDCQRRSEGLSHPPERADRDRLDQAPLDSRHELPRDSRPASEVRLPPADPNSEKANAAADTLAQH